MPTPQLSMKKKSWNPMHYGVQEEIYYQSVGRSNWRQDSDI